MSEYGGMACPDEPLNCRIKEGWHSAGTEGFYFGKININDRWWAIVKFDGQDDPDLFKAEGIEVGMLKYYSANNDLPCDVS